MTDKAILMRMQKELNDAGLHSAISNFFATKMKDEPQYLNETMQAFMLMVLQPIVNVVEGLSPSDMHAEAGRAVVMADIEMMWGQIAEHNRGAIEMSRAVIAASGMMPEKGPLH